MPARRSMSSTCSLIPREIFTWVTQRLMHLVMSSPGIGFKKDSMSCIQLAGILLAFLQRMQLSSVVLIHVSGPMKILRCKRNPCADMHALLIGIEFSIHQIQSITDGINGSFSSSIRMVSPIARIQRLIGVQAARRYWLTNRLSPGSVSAVTRP